MTPILPSNKSPVNPGERSSGSAPWRSGSTLLNALALVLVVVGLAAVFTPCLYRPISRSALAEALNKMRQVKFALDGFATDFDGRFPDSSTRQLLDPGGPVPRFSNDHFRQLITTGETQAERIFWVPDSPAAAADAPDNRIGDSTLSPGEVHWAYVTGQRNDSIGTRPLLLDPFLPDTTRFDEELWDRTVIVLTINGSARANRLRLDDHKVLDGNGDDILGSGAAAWQDSGLDPYRLLKQPETKGGPR